MIKKFEFQFIVRLTVKKYKILISLLLISLLSYSSNLYAENANRNSDIQDDYKEIEEKFLKMSGEVAEVENFIYKKDAAIFTFSKGKFLLLRPILNRPTVAIFIGEGSVKIPMPFEVEKNGLAAIAKDTIVEESFKVCYIRFSDQLDSLLKNNFQFTKGSISASDKRKVRKVQGDYFFKPTRWDFKDNYFQLLRSLYTRKSDGYFWAYFNRYVFLFDPNDSQESNVYYEREIASQRMFRGASFPREERIANCSVGNIRLDYPSSCLSQKTKLTVAGLDGYKIVHGESFMNLIKYKNDTRFFSIYLNDNLKVDSLLCDGQIVDYIRRRDFNHIGVLLPKEYLAGDSLTLSVFYHGDDYGLSYPYIENDLKFEHEIEFTTLKDYNYLFSGKIESSSVLDTNKIITLSLGRFNSIHQFIPLITGYDTISVMTDFDLPVKLVLSKSDNTSRLSNKNSFLDGKTRDKFISTLQFYNELLGKPLIEDELYLKLGYYWKSSLSGLINFPLRTSTRDELGGIVKEFSLVTAKQWFGYRSQIATYREGWFSEAFPQYLSLMCIESLVGKQFYINNLEVFRGAVLDLQNKNDDVPLASGISGWSSKGVWVIHMLRELMNSVDSVKDQSFNAWIRDIMVASYRKPLTNDDIRQLAEKHFKYELGWFFDKWVYGRGVVDFEIAYDYSKEAEGYFLNIEIETSNVSENYLAPILIEVKTKKESMFINAMVSPKYKKYKYGPFETEPSGINFNKYLRFLCESNMKEPAFNR